MVPLSNRTQRIGKRNFAINFCTVRIFQHALLPLSCLSVEKAVISSVYLICYPTGQLKYESSLSDWKWERQAPDSFPAYRWQFLGQSGHRAGWRHEQESPYRTFEISFLIFFCMFWSHYQPSSAGFMANELNTFRAWSDPSFFQSILSETQPMLYLVLAYLWLCENCK